MAGRQRSADVERAVRTIPVRPPDPGPAAAPSFAGEAPLVRRLRDQLDAAAALRCPVLLVGELGSGRTRAARWLHGRSNERAAFLSLRGLPPRPGDAPAAGTLFAPELDAAPPAVQAEWRAWLAQAPAGVRLAVSAANAWPESGDAPLFAALRRFVVAVPPLRERRDDFEALAADMAREIAGELGAPPLLLAPAALAALRRAHSIASAADLRAALERLAALAPPGAEADATLASEVIEALRPSVAALRERERCRERDALLAALRESGGNLAGAARRLGRSRAAVYRLIARHGIALGPSR